MEASAAGLASGGEAQQGEAQGEQGQQQQEGQQGQEQITQFMEQLQGMQQSQEQMREALQNAPWLQPQEEAAPEPEAPDLSFLDETSPNYDPNTAAQKLSEVMKSEGETAAERKIAEQLAPLQQQVQEMRSQQGADALAAEFPEMKDPAVAQEVVETAEKYAGILNQPELLGNFDFIRMTYMAGRAAQLANEEGSTGPQAATLEGAGGASPGGATQSAAPTADSITANWSRRSGGIPQ